MPLDKKYLNQLRNTLHDQALMRREIIKQGGDALHHAKRAIFALHRDQLGEAKKKLDEALSLLKQLSKRYGKQPEMHTEGSYKAALEEYVEAVLLYQFVEKRSVGKITSIAVPTDVYLAGLSDVPGELYRYAIRAATAGDTKTVQDCEAMSSDILAELIEFDVTKYLRTKFDQAKAAHQKLEIVLYELAIRDKK